MELVLAHNCLHWSDAISLGMTCHGSQRMYEKHRDHILSPLLMYLEEFAGSNKHRCCGKVYAPKSKRTCTCGDKVSPEDRKHPQNQDLAVMDPRYKDDYDDWSPSLKCRKMVQYISKIVSNMRLKFSFRDPSNPSKAVCGGGCPKIGAHTKIVELWLSTLQF